MTPDELFALCLEKIRETDAYPAKLKRSAAFKAFDKAYGLPGIDERPSLAVLKKAEMQVAGEMLLTYVNGPQTATDIDDAAHKLIFFAEVKNPKHFEQFKARLKAETLLDLAGTIILMEGRLPALQEAYKAEQARKDAMEEKLKGRDPQEIMNSEVNPEELTDD
jgi:NADH dehydrogenase/NADH:ubiquinone oxidoreductase subunit G